ncbi:MAG: hypothetical protein RL362_973, partial [Bacteroidota bacterium]
KKSSVQIINGYLNNGFGAKDFYVSPWDSESFEQVETFFTGINGTVESNGWTIVPRAYFRYNHDHYVFIKDNPSYYQNHHFSNTGGVELHASHANPWGLWGAGIENRNDWINSNNLGKHDRQFYSGYIEQRFNQWKDLKVIVGLNLQFSNMSHPMNYSSNGIQYYPAIDIQYKKGKGLLFAHSGTGSRLPTYTDWFYSDSGNQGNSSLVPENAFTAETGFQYQNQNFLIQGSYFYRDVKNQIDWILNSETNKYVAGNLTQCQFTGSEFAVKWNNTNKKSWFNIGNVSLRNTLLTNNIKFEGASSKYINDHLTHQAVMQLGFNTGKYIQHQIIARHYQRFNTEKPSFILDWRTQYNNANWTVFADITNLNNQEYKLTEFVIMPGRFFNLGVQYTLK